jgi:hypothetical protein
VTEIARKQSAKAFELRATMRRAMLADICNRFTEGFDTADLGDTKALLDELNG